MEGNFELNHIGYYTPILVEENTWLNDKQTAADLAKFGRNYAVIFEGDAQTYLWTAKTKPELNRKYWGHLQATSGKSIRFKTDKQEDAPHSGHSPSGGSYEGDKEDSIARAVALKAAVEFVIGNGDPKLAVLTVAEEYLAWLKNSGSSADTASTTQPAAIKVEPPPAADLSKRNPPRDWSKVGQHDEEPLPQEPEDLSFLREEYDDDSN